MHVDRKDKRFFDFACSCKNYKTGSTEAFDRWEKVYEDVKAELETDDKHFTEAVIFALEYIKNGGASIEGIYTDMWSGISVKYHYDFQEQLECQDEEGNDVGECKCEADPKQEYDCEYKHQYFWIECDRIHHGLARAYQLVKEFDASLTKKEE